MCGQRLPINIMRIQAASTKRNCRHSGFSILEMLIACVVLAVGVLGVAALMGVALKNTSATGDKATRVAEYAQDKMEELLGATFANLTAGDGITPSTPPTGFYDYIGSDGKPTTSSAGANYMRRWKIENTSTSLRTITVKVTCLTPGTPSFELVSQRASNF